MAYLGVTDELLVYTLGLHPLADKIGDSAEEGSHRCYFAVPGKEGRDALSINAGGFGAAVGIYAFISIDIEVRAGGRLLCIFLAITMFLHQARPTPLSKRTVGNTLYGVMTSSSCCGRKEMDGTPVLEIYPVTSPVAGSVMLLTEANMPGVLVTSELQVRTRSAFLKTRL